MDEQLDHIELKVRQLLEQIKLLRRENDSLSQENTKLKAEQEAQQERIAELAERLTNSQRALAQQRGDTSESSQKLRKQIDQYIIEINKCIEWLQNA